MENQGGGSQADRPIGSIYLDVFKHPHAGRLIRVMEGKGRLLYLYP